MARKIREIMTSSPVCVSPDVDLGQVARRMRDENIGDVLVTEGDTLRGVVTDRDLVVRCMAEGGDPSSTRVGDIASSADVTVGPDDDLGTAVHLMREKSVRRLPVVENGKPVGIVSIGDLAIERDEKSALADISAASPNR
ncbi:CBS domain-containing protein [Thermomonospora cellulosilytica]|uniref:CBS domain-containing protein n=1 Tax=Thermomonospora cellulosilytica TaxID=1411118 RepID=A0A7W3RAX4_9ACTN|nr:CBS domain-containing protein [Thermomonospora cellulosilytica]MBA9006362.1 CBS domain-containing protein [Thermomonospora cellulosilytica]